jgi:hypothetical protein
MTLGYAILDIDEAAPDQTFDILLIGFDVKIHFTMHSDFSCSANCNIACSLLRLPCPAALSGSLARQLCPAALPGSLARQPCPAALPGSLARQPCPAALPGSLARQPCPSHPCRNITSLIRLKKIKNLSTVLFIYSRRQLALTVSSWPGAPFQNRSY